jgi:Ras-related protein Rab-32
MLKSGFQCDQQKEGLVNNSSKMEEYCKEQGFTAWFETSANENINIEDAARCLVSKVSKLCVIPCFTR